VILKNAKQIVFLISAILACTITVSWGSFELQKAYSKQRRIGSMQLL